MTTEEITNTVKSIETKISEIKSILTDMNSCSSETSKTILLAAASKLTQTLANINTQSR